MNQIIYVDDEPNNLLTIKAGLRKWYKIHTVDLPSMVIDSIKPGETKLVISDQRMPEMTGLELVEIIQKKFPDIINIILTAYDDNQTMLNAINQGGIYRYLLKPVEISDLKQTIDSAIETYNLRVEKKNLIDNIRDKNARLESALNEVTELKRQLEEENYELKQEINRHDFSKIIGRSKTLIQTLKMLKQVAESDSTVLLLGETGTGKELFASAIHEKSKRKNNALIKLNCAAIPENLIESELFGFEKGAFTGAEKSKPGKFELANNGTIFLDEIGELPLAVQSKLLRVLQEREIERIGSTKVLPVDVRVVAATNRNLEDEVNKGNFREDLFYRLNVVPIQIPPLRNRSEDIPDLIEFFISRLNRRMGRKINIIPSGELQKLLNYAWPGNIRELENVIERAYVLSSGNKLEINASELSSKNQNIKTTNNLVSLQQNEKEYIIKVLDKTGWKIRGNNGAANLLDINPSTLESRMKKLNIKKPSLRSEI